MKRTIALALLGGFVLGCLVGFLLFAPSPQPKPKVDPFAPQAMTGPGGMAPNLGGTESHGHALAEADPSLPLPTVRAQALADTMGGFNLHVETSNYLFTPELAGKPPKQGGGHAHIFVNGTKVGRLYGNWAYLGASLFHPGKNEIEVTLNANDHSEWVRGGQHIGALVSVTLP